MPSTELFRAIPAEDISARLRDGRWIVDLRELPSVAGQRVLRMNFAAGRIGPHDLEVAGALEVRRVRESPGELGANSTSWGPRNGVHSWDALLPGDLGATRLTWIEPAEGAYLLQLGSTSSDAMADEIELLTDAWVEDGSHANLPGYEAAVAQIHADGTRDENQKRASRFWLALDLTTSLENPERERGPIAERLGIDETLIAVDPNRRKWLTDMLAERWMARTSCAAMGVPFDHIMIRQNSDAYQLSLEVIELVRTLAALEFDGGLADAAPHIAAFACGALRRPYVGERLNIEPNSIFMASFAEVADLAAVPPGTPASSVGGDTEILRRTFVAMLRPFFDNYAMPTMNGVSRQASDYLFQNLDGEPGSQARRNWTDDAVLAHCKQIAALSHEEFLQRWGDELLYGLSGEVWVRKAFNWRMIRPVDGRGGDRRSDAGRATSTHRAPGGSASRRAARGRENDEASNR